MTRRNVTASSSGQVVRRPESLPYAVSAIANQLSTLVSQLLSATLGDGVPGFSAVPGFSIDAAAQDVETDNNITIRHRGQLYAIAAIAAFDISVAATCAGDTITNNKFGAFWFFINTAGAGDMEDADGNQALNSAIEALARYSVATNVLPPGTDDVLVGAMTVAPTGGTFTVGTTALTGIVTFYDLIRKPSVEIEAATFAKDAAAATFSYGAVTFVLGSGTRVAATGKNNVAISGSNIANNAFGTFLVYGLADDVETVIQLGAAYTSYQAAKDAIRDHNPNPLLALIGTIIVENRSGSAFVPGTTKLDASGITTTFQKNGQGANAIEVGRNQWHQPFSAADDLRINELGIPL